MSILINIVVVIATFFFMEFVAWATHKYIMHGLLWSWHKDHHQKEPGFFEKNDRFFLVFAVPSMIFFILGSSTSYPILLFVGAGILLYGICYFLVHDVFIHRRFQLFKRANHKYFKAIRRAHKVHHQRTEKEDGQCFGMLIVPPKFYQEAK